MANNGSNSILIFDNAGSINGETVPNRAVSGGQTNLSNPAGLFVDANILYVSATNNAVLVFINASSANGDIPPTQTFSGASTTLNNPGGLFVASNVLYVANPGNNSIIVFNNASAGGNITPDRTISDAGAPLSFPGGIAVDAARNLAYVAKAFTLRFENASAIPALPVPANCQRIAVPNFSFAVTWTARAIVPMPPVSTLS